MISQRSERQRAGCRPSRLRLSFRPVPIYVICTLLLSIGLVAGQLPYPLRGQGGKESPPVSVGGQPNLTVAVSALLERALGMNPEKNTYEVRH